MGSVNADVCNQWNKVFQFILTIKKSCKKKNLLFSTLTRQELAGVLFLKINDVQGDVHIKQTNKKTKNFMWFVNLKIFVFISKC